MYRSRWFTLLVFAGVLGLGTAAASQCTGMPDWASMPPARPPLQPGLITVQYGDPCPASDPVQGTVPGSRVEFSWTAANGGYAATTYMLTLFVILPGEAQTTTTIPGIPSSQLNSGWLCFPPGTHLYPGIVGQNSVGSSPSSGMAGGDVWVPTVGLHWSSPASITDGVAANYSAIDPCPTTRPDGKVVGGSAVQVTLTTASGNQNQLTGGTNWSLSGVFNNQGVQDLSASVIAYCVDAGSVGSGTPLLVAVYEPHPIAVNP